MKAELPAATGKAGIEPSQIARSTHTLRLQMALDEAQRLARGERIKQLREESAYTQPVLAEKVGVTLRAYQRWEAGGGIEWEHLEKLAELHEVDPQWIHRGHEKGTTPDPLASESGEAVAALQSKLDEVLDGQAELLAVLSEVRDEQERLQQRQARGARGKAANGS